MRRFNLSEWAVHHQALVLFFIIALTLGGLFSYQRLGRSEDPSFTIKLAVVSILWPGATAQEMQSQVAEPMEKKLQELPYFDRVQTYSKPGFSAMQVFFKDSTPAKEVPYLFYLTRKKLVDMQGELPQGVIGPIINDEYGDVDSILYMLTGDGADYAQLKKVADALRQKTLKVPNVIKVNLYGIQDQKIFVEFSHAKLATLGITPQVAVRFACQTECGCPRWRRRNLVTTCCSACDWGSRRRQSGGGDAGRGQRARVPPGRHRHRHPRVRGSVRFHGPPARQGRDRRRHRDGQGRQPAAARRGPEEVHRRVHEDGADRRRYRADRRPAAGGRARHQGIPPLVPGGARDRAGGQLPLARLAYRHRGRDLRAAGAGDRLRRHELHGHGPAPHHAWRADHCARPAGRRRDHRRRDDDREDGAGGRPAEGRIVRLGFDRVPDVDGHADHGGGLPADRSCGIRRRRIRRRHLLDRLDRAARLMGRCRDLHALSRRQAVAEFCRASTR